MTTLEFEVLKTDGQARTGKLTTAHGCIDTPAFMPVGTAATIKAMTPDAVAQTGAQCILANTYHLMLRPGADIVRDLGGRGHQRLFRSASWSDVGSGVMSEEPAEDARWTGRRSATCST